MQRLTLFIPGIPKPKQSVRSRVIQSNGRSFAHHYQTKEVKDEERSIKMIIREQLPKGFVCHTGPVSVSYIVFQFPPLKSMKKSDMYNINNGGAIPKTTKPDLTDNLMKGLFDAMEGLVYTNDSLIYRIGSSCKVYHREPGTALVLELYAEKQVI